jgi:hypothetical protein
MSHCHISVTPNVFKFIGPSNDGRRHGRGIYLFDMKIRFSLENVQWKKLGFLGKKAEATFVAYIKRLPVFSARRVLQFGDLAKLLYAHRKVMLILFLTKLLCRAILFNYLTLMPAESN